MAQVGAVYLNFGLWALALVPGWLVVKEIGSSLGDRKVEREKGLHRVEESASIDETKGVGEIREILPKD